MNTRGLTNHLFQVIALLAMEPPALQSFAAVHSAKASVLRAMLPIKPADLVRGQYIGYRDETGVAKDSNVETFCALRLFIDSWRWAGVPWNVRAGKRLPASVVEVQVQMHPPPQQLFDDSGPAGFGAEGRANYFRFRLQPDAGITLAARVKRPGKEFVGVQRDQLHELGQRLWVDSISRGMLVQGLLSRYIADGSVTRLTSNPTIFEHAIGHGSFYDQAIARLAGRGEPAEQLFFALALEDLTAAADLLRPIFEATDGLDGWVSFEVSPLLADNAAKTIRAAAWLHEAVDRPNLFI